MSDANYGSWNPDLLAPRSESISIKWNVQVTPLKKIAYMLVGPL